MLSYTSITWHGMQIAMTNSLLACLTSFSEMYTTEHRMLFLELLSGLCIDYHYTQHWQLHAFLIGSAAPSLGSRRQQIEDMLKDWLQELEDKRDVLEESKD